MSLLFRVFIFVASFHIWCLLPIFYSLISFPPLFIISFALSKSYALMQCKMMRWGQVSKNTAKHENKCDTNSFPMYYSRCSRMNVCVGCRISVVVVLSSEKRRTSLHFIFWSLIVIQCEKLFLCTSNDFLWNHRHYVFRVRIVSLLVLCWMTTQKGQRLWLCMMITFDDSNTFDYAGCRHIVRKRKIKKELDWDCIVCDGRSWWNPC